MISRLNADAASSGGSASFGEIAYDTTRDFQVLFDQGEQLINRKNCNEASASSQFFSDVIVHVPGMRKAVA